MCTNCRLVNNTLKMEYKIELGQISRSYGIDLAESIGLPKDVIESARKYAEGLEKFEDEITHSRPGKMETEPPIDKYSVSYETKLKMLSYANGMKEKYNGILPSQVFEEVRSNLLRMR